MPQEQTGLVPQTKHGAIRRVQSGDFHIYSRHAQDGLGGWKLLRPDPQTQQWASALLEEQTPKEGMLSQAITGLGEGVTLGISPATRVALDSMRAMGMDPAEGPPKSIMEGAFRTGGQVLGSLPPVLAGTALTGGMGPVGAATLRYGGPAVQKAATVGRMLTRPYLKHPVIAPLTEVVAGGAAGAGGYIGQGTPFESPFSIAAALAAGMATASLPGQALTKYLPSGAGSILDMLTPAGRARTREQAQRVRDMATSTLTTDPVSPMSPGVRQVAEAPFQEVDQLTGEPDDWGNWKGYPSQDPDPRRQQKGQSAAGTYEAIPESFSFQRAAHNIASRVSDPEAVRESLKEEAISEFTTLAQQTGDLNLLRHAHFLIAMEGPVAFKQYVRDAKEAIQYIGAAAARTVRGQATETEALPELPDIVQRLRRELEDRVTDLGGGRRRPAIARTAADDIRTAYDDALKENSRLWKAATDESERLGKTVKTAPMVEALGREFREVEITRRGDIPQFLIDRWEKWAGPAKVSVETPRELHALYSRLLEITRETANFGTNKARLAGEFAGIIRDTGFGTIPEYKNARAYTRALHARTDERSVVHGLFTSAGEPGTPISIRRNPTELFESLGLGSGTPTNATVNTVRDILDLSAFQGPPASTTTPPQHTLSYQPRSNQELIGALEEHFQRNFLEASKDETGRPLMNPDGAQEYMATMREMFEPERFPELQRLATDMSQNTELSRRFLHIENMRQQAGDILTSDRPLALMRSKSQLGAPGRPGKTGTLADRELWAQAIFDEATRIAPGTVGAGSFRPDAGHHLLELLDNPNTRAVFQALHTDEQITNLTRMATEWRNVERVFLGAKDEIPIGVIAGSELIEDTVIGRLLKFAKYFSRVEGAALSEIVPGSGGMGSQFQIAARTASEAERTLTDTLNKQLWEVLRIGYRHKSVLNDLLANASTLDASTLGRIYRWIKSKVGQLAADRIKAMLVPTGMAATKSIAPSPEEQQELAESIKQRLTSFAPRSREDQYLPRPSLIGQPEITPAPPPGPRIGPPRR